MESKEKRQKIYDGAGNNLPAVGQQLTQLFQQVLSYTNNLAAMPVDVQDNLPALDAQQVAEFAKLREIEGLYSGVTGFWLASALAFFWVTGVLALSSRPTLLDKILILPDAEFQRLDFNAAPQHADRKDKGVSVLWQACELARRCRSALLDKILALPDAEFQRLDFNAAPQHADRKDKGISVLWQACYLAFEGHPALLDKLLDLPDAVFQRLDFNAAPQHTDRKDKGISVLWWACELARRGRSALFDKILALPDAVFQRLDFNAGPQHAENKNKGISVLWRACEFALRGHSALLDKLLDLPDAVFQRLDFNAPPSDFQTNESVIIGALRLLQQNGHERLLVRICETVRGAACASFEANIPDIVKRIEGYVPVKTLMDIISGEVGVDWIQIGHLVAQCKEAGFSESVQSAFLYRAYCELPQLIENLSTIKLVLEQLPFDSHYFSEVCQGLSTLYMSRSKESDAVQKQERKLKMALKYSLLARLSSAGKQIGEFDYAENSVMICAHYYFRLPTSGNQDIDKDKINQLTTQWLEHVAMAEEQSAMTTDQAVTVVENLLEQLQSMRAELDHAGCRVGQ